MGYSKIELCNLALLSIGQAPIQSLTESSNEAVYCAAFYDAARRELLRDHGWNFATKVIELAQLSDGPVDFAYAYALPADLLRIIEPVYSGSTSTSETDMYYPDNIDDYDPKAAMKEVMYQIRANAAGDNILVTDQGEFFLKYTYDCDDPNKYDSQFASCFSYLLASKIALPITGLDSMAQYMMQTYNTLLVKARGTDASEGRSPDYLGMSFVDARR